MSMDTRAGRRAAQARILSLMTIALTAGCGPQHDYEYPGRDATVLIQADGERLAAAGRRNQVFVRPARMQLAVTVGAPEGDVGKIGSFVGPWSPTAIAWLDETTVAICPLAGDRAAKTTIQVPVTPETRATIRIVTRCPDPAHAPIAG